mgnify:FL=1
MNDIMLNTEIDFKDTARFVLFFWILSAPMFFASKAKAQTQVGVMGGVALYSGDLSPKEFGVYFKEVQPAYGVFARFSSSRFGALRLGVSRGTLTGDDSKHNREDRGLAFRTRVTEFSLLGELNLFRIGTARNRGVVPYLLGGIAVFQFNPEAPFDGDYIELQPLGTEGQGLPNYDDPYRLTQLAIPLGAGVNIKVNEKLTIGLEFGGRLLFTDYLDDVTNTEVSYFDVLEGNGELAARLSRPTVEDPTEETAYRRGGEYNDWYYIGGVSLAFTIGGKNRGGQSG